MSQADAATVAPIADLQRWSRSVPGAWQTVAIALVAIASVQGVSLLLLTSDPRLAMVWLPGGAFLGALLILPRQRWLPFWIGSLAGEALAFAAVGQAWPIPLGVAAGSFALATLATMVLQRYPSERTPLEDFELLTAFIGVAGILLPMIDAAWVLVAWRQVGFAGNAFDWLNIALSRSLGCLLLAPALIGHALAGRPRHHHFNLRAKLIGLLLLCAPCAAWAVPTPPAYLAPLLMLAPAPFIVWGLLRYGLVGACYAILVVALLAFGLSHAGRGPFVLGDARQTVIGLQLLFAWGAMAMLYLSVMAEQRRGIHGALDVLNRKMSLVAGNLINAQEIERGRIARDLHDDINQSVASVSIKLSIAKQLSEGAVHASLEELQEEVIAVSEDIRQLSHRLHPSLLRYTGLAPALRALCSVHAARGLYVLDAAIDDGIVLPPAPALALYRIAQEALGNVDAHARASHVGMSLAREGAHVVFQVIDDGVGFVDIAHHGPEVGLGLISMEERAKAIDARFDLQTTPGAGTRLRVVLPAGGPA